MFKSLEDLSKPKPFKLTTLNESNNAFFNKHSRSKNKDLANNLPENKFIKSTNIEDTDNKPESINNSNNSNNSNEEESEKLTNNVKKSQKTTTHNQKISKQHSTRIMAAL
ncbi:7149_t:CDS:1, partial [Cetraspora pellucida]